jgi:hypothetical protein
MNIISPFAVSFIHYVVAARILSSITRGRGQGIVELSNPSTRPSGTWAESVFRGGTEDFVLLIPNYASCDRAYSIKRTFTYFFFYFTGVKAVNAASCTHVSLIRWVVQ